MYIAIMLTIALITGCATSKSSVKAKPEYLIGSNPTASPATIEKNLTTSAGSLKLMVVAYPVTEPLIIARANEATTKNMDSPEVAIKTIAGQKVAFTNDKTCFNISLVTTNGIESGQFKHYRAKLEQDSKLSEVVFRNKTGVESVPSFQQLGFPTWTNNSYACSETKVDLTKPFSLHVIPQLEPEGAKISLTWQ